MLGWRRSCAVLWNPFYRKSSILDKYSRIRCSYGRLYSSLIGSIEQTGDHVEILIPRGLEAADQFREQMRKDRELALQITEAAVLRKQLGEFERQIVFDGDPADSAWADEKIAPTYTMRWGETTKEIKLIPRKSKGRLGRKILHVIAYTSETAAEVKDSLNALEECLRSPNLRKNMDSSVLPIVLRRAASAGIYNEIFDRIMSPDTIFKKHCTGKFYLEALRIQALRTPYSLGLHPKAGAVSKLRANLLELYVRAEKGPTRGICLAYALAVIQQRVPSIRTEISAELVNIISEIESIGFKTHPLRIDLLLYHEALRMARLQQFELARRNVERILGRNSRNKELQTHYSVNISDLKERGGIVSHNWGAYNKQFAFFNRNIAARALSKEEKS